MKKNNNKNNNWISRIKIGNTGNIFLAKFYSLKYAGSTTLGCKHIVIKKSELVGCGKDSIALLTNQTFKFILGLLISSRKCDF